MIDKSAVVSALDKLMAALNLTGESGTERLCDVIEETGTGINWSLIERSHREGLCYDMRFELAEAMIKAVE